MYEQFWEMVPPDVSYTNTQQTPNLKYRKCVNYLFPILSGWEIIHAWEVNILIMSLPSSTSTRSLTRFVCAFRRAIACSISRNSTNAEKWFEDCVIIHWYVKYNLDICRHQIFIYHKMSYVLERDCELLHASFLNCTMENNENTKIEVFIFRHFIHCLRLW